MPHRVRAVSTVGEWKAAVERRDAARDLWTTALALCLRAPQEATEHPPSPAHRRWKRMALRFLTGDIERHPGPTRLSLDVQAQSAALWRSKIAHITMLPVMTVVTTVLVQFDGAFALRWVFLLLLLAGLVEEFGGSAAAKKATVNEHDNANGGSVHRRLLGVVASFVLGLCCFFAVMMPLAMLPYYMQHKVDGDGDASIG